MTLCNCHFHQQRGQTFPVLIVKGFQRGGQTGQRLNLWGPVKMTMAAGLG